MSTLVCTESKVGCLFEAAFVAEDGDDIVNILD
jgi:hypothetical protein